MTNIKFKFILAAMIRRNLEIPLKKYVSQYPVIAIVGPRQSGKTTIAKAFFKKHAYVSLENLDMRLQAQQDPRGFLHDNPSPLIIDEAQRVPELFSYLQEIVDTNDRGGQYVLTGSHQFLLLEKITQSLAGRIAVFTLYPFTTNELISGILDYDIKSIITVKKDNHLYYKTINVNELIFTGMYPRIHDKKLDPVKWLENYVITYIERDIRSLVQIENLRLFEIFIKTIASHSGQLTNYAAIANMVGISQPTVKKWMSLLETSGIIFLLQPYHKNFNKRLIKTPKLYFVDTGLLCFLLSIRSPKELIGHPLYGNIFETFIISEIYKRIAHTGTVPPLYFWRDRTGNEVDLLVENGQNLFAIEIKAARTYNPDFASQITKFFAFSNAHKGLVVYAGDQAFGMHSKIPTIPWWML
ncbi:MAG: ATP-binding protein [Spirochaetes bacterium]|nr:ATP-binding protein [Spirochaetota bacterium]